MPGFLGTTFAEFAQQISSPRDTSPAATAKRKRPRNNSGAFCGDSECSRKIREGYGLAAGGCAAAGLGAAGFGAAVLALMG